MKTKLPPYDIKRLTDLLASPNGKDEEGSNYMSGPDLIEMFNSLGFKDAYENGIQAEGLPSNCSRKQYTKERLKQLNEEGRADEVINAYMGYCKNQVLAKEVIDSLSLGNMIAAGQTTPQKAVVASKRTSRFAPPPGQLDNIPKDVPVAFISYAWDNQNHRDWVLKFANDLRANGVYALLDQFNPKGESLTGFMTRGIERADRVLVIGSPRYKEKVDNPNDHSGATFEDQILTIDLYHGIERKYIPILRIGTFEESFSKLMSEKNGIDFRDDTKYDDNLNELIKELYGRPSNTPPPLGKPAFMSGNPKGQVTLQSPAGVYNAQLADPFQGEKFLKALLENFSFNIMDEYFQSMPERFDMRISDSYDAWEATIGSSVFVIHDKQINALIMDFFNVWKKITDEGLLYYSPSNNHVDYHFYPLKGDVITDVVADDCFQRIMSLLPQMQESYHKMTTYIKDNYPNIDLDSLSRDFEIRFAKR